MVPICYFYLVKWCFLFLSNQYSTLFLFIGWYPINDLHICIFCYSVNFEANISLSDIPTAEHTALFLGYFVFDPKCRSSQYLCFVYCCV